MARRYRATIGRTLLRLGTRHRVLGALGLTTVLVVVVAGTVAFADIPDSGVVHACYDRDSGRVRIVDKTGCADHERKITWNARGPEGPRGETGPAPGADRKSTRLNSSHVSISYAVFCLKKKKRT